MLSHTRKDHLNFSHFLVSVSAGHKDGKRDHHGEFVPSLWPMSPYDLFRNGSYVAETLKE